MKISVESRDFNKKIELKGTTVSDLFVHLNLNREEFVVSLNGRIVLEQARVKDGDIVKLFPVISGG